jgi:hypothetical protein
MLSHSTIPATARRRGGPALLATFLALSVAACSQESTETETSAAEASVDYCALVSDDTLAKLYDKPLHATALGNGCMWSEKPGGIAYLDFNMHEYRREPREYFDAEPPSHVRLVEITDLGDGGFMTVSDGGLGVVVIRNGDRVMQSAATFLDIKPGSEQHKILWEIYRQALDQ